jgi:hypothetical protein
MSPTPDRAARLARWLKRNAYAPMTWPRLVLMGTLVFVTLVCALWETALQHAAAGVALGWASAWDYAYAPFLYVVPQTSLAHATTLSPPQEIARIVGPLIPLLGLFWLVRQRLMVWLADLLIAHRAKGHHVILGSGGSADGIARASSLAGEVVVLVDPSVADDEDRQQTLGGAGVVCLHARGKALGRAGAVLVWQASDAENIATAVALRSGQHLAVGEIDLSLESTELHHALLQSPDLMLDHTVRLRPHSVSGAAVRASLASPELLQLAIDRDQPCVTLCLWGRSDALVWAAEIALKQFWSARLAAPRILWVTPEGAGALPDIFAGLCRNAGEVFGTTAATPQMMAIPAEAALAEDGVTCHLIDAGQPDATLAQAFALAADLRQRYPDPAPVRAILSGSGAIAPLFATSQLAFLAPITPGAGLTLAALRDRRADREAARIHMAYARAFGQDHTLPASGHWRELDETYVAANRAAADHLSVKQWDAATAGLEGAALIEAMAEAEHHRWCAERLLSGWAPAGARPRDNIRRLHPDLRPWAALDEKGREKDRDAVRGALSPAPNP